MHMFQQPRPTPKCFGGNTVKALSITQIVCGSLAILLGIAIIIPGSQFSWTGYPIWTGALFLSTGIIGIFAAKRKTKCMIIPLMVLSVLSSILAGTATLVLAAIALSSNDVWGWCWNFPRSECPMGAIITFDVLLILLALLELGLAIATSVMTCYAICPGCTEGSTVAPAVAYQVGADGRLVQIPGQYVMQGGQPIAMTPFPPNQPQYATALPSGAASLPSGAVAQQPLLVTQTPGNMAAAQGTAGAGQGPKPEGNIVFVPVQGVAPAPRQHQVEPPVAISTGGHGNMQYVISTSTPTAQATVQQPLQSVPQVQFQQPSQAAPYPHPAQIQPQQQPTVPQRQVSATPTGFSPPPSYQPTEPDARGVVNQAMTTEQDDVPLIED
ncbi:uncharacterized protein LOC144870879 [Branchiostoma floridae x Branchiostoma japonicum]